MNAGLPRDTTIWGQTGKEREHFQMDSGCPKIKFQIPGGSFARLRGRRAGRNSGAG